MVSLAQSQAKPWYPEIDIVKGITILLVILGHSFCTSPVDLYSEFPLLGKIVRSFQMPLFFVVSGFVFSFSDNILSFIKKKVNRLIIPWFVFSVLTIGLKAILASYTHQGITGLDSCFADLIQGHYYWFLYALMVIMIICRIVVSPYILAILSLASVAVCLTTDVKDCYTFEIGRIIYFFPYFCIGLFLRRYYGKLAGMARNAVITTALLCIAIYAGCMFIPESNRLISLYLAALSGSVFVYCTAIIIKDFEMPVIKHFGKYSLQYYLNHLLIMVPIYVIVSQISTPPHF